MRWANETLGEICDIGGGVVKTGPFGSQLHKSDYQEDGIPVVMPKDIVSGGVSIESIAKVGEQHIERLHQHKLSVGDIVYGRRGDIGRHALVREREKGWLCGTGCLRISLGDGPVDPVFLHYCLNGAELTKWIENHAVGATMPNLNTTILRSVPIRYPQKGNAAHDRLNPLHIRRPNREQPPPHQDSRGDGPERCTASGSWSFGIQDVRLAFRDVPTPTRAGKQSGPLGRSSRKLGNEISVRPRDAPDEIATTIAIGDGIPFMEDI